MKNNCLRIFRKALCLATLATACLFTGNYAVAQDFTVGAQGCMPMNLPLAQTLQWRAEGLTNNNTVEQWVVCPLALDTFDNNVDVKVRIRNRSEATTTVQCLWKTTSALGEPIKSFSLRSDPVPPEAVAIMAYKNINYIPGDAMSVSCLLPPKFSIISFSVELVDD